MANRTTIFVNETKLEVLDDVAALLSTNGFWFPYCGFHNGYGDGTGVDGVLNKVAFVDKEAKYNGDLSLGGYNWPHDFEPVGDDWYDGKMVSWYNEKIYVNQERLFNSDEWWVGVILHELAHGSNQIDTAAAFLAE